MCDESIKIREMMWGFDVRKLLVSLAAGVAMALGLARASPVCLCPCPTGPPLRRHPPPAYYEPLRNPPAAAAGNTNAGLAASTVQINGRTHYYQIPKNPRGTLFVFPGCVRTGYGFWPAGGCKECAGLPEDVAHAKQALARGYAIVVFTAGGKSLCWGSATDGEFIRTAIPQFLDKQPALRGKAVYVMGASSGGGLMQRNLGNMGVQVDGVIALVATSADVSDIVRSLRGKKAPPIVWITMAEPKEIAKAKGHVNEYKRHAPAAMASTSAHKITDAFFSDRHPLLTPPQSAQMAAALRKLGVIRADGSLAGDPKKNRTWLKKLTDSLPFLRGNKNFQVAPIQKAALLQAVLVAQAKHEHVCDYLTAALAWLERGGKGDFQALAAKYQVVRPSALTMARQVDGAEPTPAEAFAYGQSTARAGRLLTSVSDQPGSYGPGQSVARYDTTFGLRALDPTSVPTSFAPASVDPASVAPVSADPVSFDDSSSFAPV